MAARGAVVAIVAMSSATVAQARPRPSSASPVGDSAAFVHAIRWSATSPTTGVTLLSGVYSDPIAAPFWTVTIQAPAQSPFGAGAEVAEAGSFAWASGAEASLEADGFDPSATVLPWPRYVDDPRGVMGVRVRVGDFATQSEPTPRRQR
jgi:hypothetical protein